MFPHCVLTFRFYFNFYGELCCRLHLHLHVNKLVLTIVLGLEEYEHFQGEMIYVPPLCFDFLF